MSHNCGNIHVDARGLSQAQLVDAVIAYWKKKKAVVDKASPLDIEPLNLEDADEPARLGYAISPAVKAKGGTRRAGAPRATPSESSWFTICDSEQYSADASLAAHLARVLKTRVAWTTLWGASSQGAVRLFGTWKRKAPEDTYDDVWSFASEFPHGTTQFGDLANAKARKGFALVGFKAVEPDAYDFGPGPSEPAPKKTTQKGATSTPKRSVAKVEEDALQTISESFSAKDFKAVAGAIARLTTAEGRWRALEKLTDDTYCMSVSIKTAAAHRLVLALADQALVAPLSRSLATWVEKKREMSPHMVAVAYAGTLEAAAWANDAKRFAAALALIDVADKKGALQRYCEESAARLTSLRPTFAKKLRSLAESLPRTGK